jgi:hypothetical protein
VAWVDGGQVFPERWFWQHGELSNDLAPDRRYPYFHFIVWKKTAWRELPPPRTSAIPALAASGRWMIDATGFHPLPP